ncbi:MAG: NADH-quinone oxidoreductase subunit H [Candidatus Omnitrophica bacterium]|nr:NADH-quinone oxidoreductase subunit H [Candidatus Omnitrophota bacterium]
MSAIQLLWSLGLVIGGPPLLLGVIHKTKAILTGRIGAPVLQPYYDLWKLLQKGAVYSRTTSWVFRAGPLVSLAAFLTAALFVPLAAPSTLLSFWGDVVLWAYLVGVARFITVLAALDTGSSFEGMGASREVTFASLAEPALLVALAVIAKVTGSVQLSEMFGPVLGSAWRTAGPALALAAASLFLVLLAENARMPVDDPTTHLELTMIHEVMVLDHGGPDFAFILYGSALKLFLFGVLLVRLLMPVHIGVPWMDLSMLITGLLGLAVVIGVVESSMARLRLIRVPQLLVTSGVLAAVGLLLVWR